MVAYLMEGTAGLPFFSGGTSEHFCHLLGPQRCGYRRFPGSSPRTSPGRGLSKWYGTEKLLIVRRQSPRWHCSVIILLTAWGGLGVDALNGTALQLLLFSTAS